MSKLVDASLNALLNPAIRQTHCSHNIQYKNGADVQQHIESTPRLIRRSLSRAGFDVPVIGMGTSKTFETTDDRRAIVQEALSVGVDLFDSSPMYGNAELVLADALEADRQSARVATKVWSESEDEGRRQAERSLDLFGTIDIYQIHNLVGWRTQLRLLEELKSQHKVRAIGATLSMLSPPDEMVLVMRSKRLDAIQIRYSPLRQDTEPLLALASELGIGVLIMAPLQGAILGARPTVEELSYLGVPSWPLAVLKWIVSDVRVGSVLVGTKRQGRATGNAHAGQLPLFTAEQRKLVSEIARRNT